MDGITSLTLSTQAGAAASETRNRFEFDAVIDDICELPWETLDGAEVIQVAKAYYYFSIQFRENLEIACRLRPDDEKLKDLTKGECDTDNLSPWPGVAAVGEQLDHDEFMRRLLILDGVDWSDYLARIGQVYLDRVRNIDDLARATSIASYEDGGLSRVFSAMLRAPDWQGVGAVAFKFFLDQHILFDMDDGGGHGLLSRHLPVDDAILPLWIAFRELMIAAVPRFWQSTPAVGEADCLLAMAAE